MSARHHDDRTEAELVEAFREGGNPAIFEALYLRTRREVYGVCARLLRNPARAEEACHDAFVQAFERFSTLRGDNFSAWIHRIATNLCLNRLRDRRDAAPIPEDLADPRSLPSVESPVSREDLERATEVLGELPPAQRRALLLKYIEGRSYDEIAGITGESLDQVRSHLQNGRRGFRILWDRRLAVRRDHG
jgi:RNA polymerase sigma-70 factor (ECF subfamily)